MVLDARTLYLVAVMTMTVLGLVSLTFASLRPINTAIRLWGVSLLILAVGLALVSLRGLIPDALSIVASNALIAASAVVGYRSLRLLLARAASDYLGWLLVGLVTAESAYYCYAEPDIVVRVASLSATVAFFMFRNALLLASDVPEETKNSRRITAAVFAFLGAVHALRVFLVLLSGRPEDLLAPHWPDALMMLTVMAAITCGTLGLFWFEIRRLQHGLIQLASVDSLTEALTRRAFSAAFVREISRQERDHGTFGLALFDIDHFKRINDEQGHLAGDALLRSVAEALRQDLRAHDVLCRYGGEEFVVLLPLADKTAAVAIAERARRAIENKALGELNGKVLTVSAGVAAYPDDGRDWTALIGAADSALYAAKTSGRNRVAAAAQSLSTGQHPGDFAG